MQAAAGFVGLDNIVSVLEVLRSEKELALAIDQINFDQKKKKKNFQYHPALRLMTEFGSP